MDFSSKPIRLFIFLGGFFICSALLAEFVGVKIFSLEKALGLEPVDWTILGNKGLSFNLTAGVLLWPLVFVLTDIINEYYGSKGVRLLSFLTVGLILYSFFVVGGAIHLEPADFWPQSHISPDWSSAEKAEALRKVGDYNEAYRLIFGQGRWIIIGSVIAFLIGQLLDVFVFHRLKSITGDSQLWLRATGSTLVSQFIDSFLVLFVAFYLGAGWDLSQVIGIGIVNYLYKFVVAILLTPAIYLAHYIIDRYLGQELSEKLRFTAQNQS